MADDPAQVVERYYDALDAHRYDALADALAPSFVQQRPDRTFEGRAAFVGFMRDERPVTESTHDLEEVIADGDRVAVRGRVVDDEEVLFAFADFFALADGQITRLDTYTR
jgi:ketosteroid isomerase-like protein